MKRLVTAVAILLVAPSSASAGRASVTLTQDGTFTVPAGVTAVTVVAIGGHGQPAATAGARAAAAPR